MAAADVELVKRVIGLIGYRLISYITSAKHGEEVLSWERGQQLPLPAQERLLLTADLFARGAEFESEDTLRAWFIGKQPDLDDQSPAELIKTQRVSYAREALFYQLDRFINNEFSGPDWSPPETSYPSPL